MIEPGGIPQYTGDFAQLEKAASNLRTRATGIRTGGKDVHSRFQAMAAYYKAPEADKLFSSTQPVMDTAEEFAGNIESLADALDTFIHDAKPHADRLKQLKLDAIDFVDSVRGDDDWTEDQSKTDAHQALIDGVAAAREGFQEAERNAANKIDAISPGACRPKWIVDDGTHGLGMYGQNADTLKGMKDLPWGSPEGRTYERWSLDWWGHGAKSWAWDGIAKDSIWGGIDGLVTLIGFHGEQERDQAWDGLKRTAVGGYAYGMDLFGQDEHLSDWQRDSKAYAKEFGKQFIAYDMTAEDPARAHAVFSFNVLTLASGPLAAASKLGKGGTFAKAAGTMAKIGDALDPLGGAFKAAKALSDLPKVSQVLANVSDHLQIPKSKFPDGAFDLNDRYRVEKDGKFVPLDPDGNPHLEPAKREPSAAERGVGGPQGDRELVGVGGRAPGATAHVGDNLPPRAGRDVGGGGGAGDGTHGPRGDGGAARGGDLGHTGAGDHGSGGGLPDKGAGPGGDASGSPHGDAPGTDVDGTPGGGAVPPGGAGSTGVPGVDPARYGTRADDFAQAHSGPIRGEQEAGVLGELDRMKMSAEDQQRVIRSLRKDPYGAGVAELINRGHLRNSEEYRKILDMCKKGPSRSNPEGSMVPAAYMALTHATELQNRGFTRIGFEFGEPTDPWDIDVYTRHADGSMDYGYQLKDVNSINRIKKSAQGAADQLVGYRMTHSVAILDVHQPLSGLTPAIFEAVARAAEKTGGTYLLRFEDAAITIPPDGSIFP
ncbi:hypothetical protein [Streptomyces atratus]|uniref:hypothetical protein n=1 Tax=Streptomyces atratus TaxID=1893 RepID=UPI0022549710|nr:hypothetical protein [Streptomyces atratus]MCX5341814.1 hypothetical protein [Streptomyces atratus]